MTLKAQLIWCVDRGEGQKGGKQRADLSMKQSDEKILPARETCPTQKCMSLDVPDGSQLSAETYLLASLRA